MKKIILIAALLATGVAHAGTKKINLGNQLFVSSLDGVSMAINDQLKAAAANACGGPNNVALLTDIKILIKAGENATNNVDNDTLVFEYPSYKVSADVTCK